MKKPDVLPPELEGLIGDELSEEEVAEVIRQANEEVKSDGS